MESVRIQTFEARYHLPPSAAGERSRLDRLLPEVVGEGLESALERYGIGPEEEVCLREVRVPVRLGRRAGDGAVVAAWSLALAESIYQAVRAGGPGVVRYATRRHALVDFATRVARGDLGRTWAWAQLGFCDSVPVSPEASARALATEDGGTAVVPVLAELAANGALAALAPRLGDGDWERLARAGMRAAGWPEEALDGAALPEAPTDGETVTAESVRRLAEAFRGRDLALSLARLSASKPGAEVRRAVAVLALLDAEPAPAGGPRELARKIDAAVEILLADAPGRQPETGADTPLQRAPRPPRRGHEPEPGGTAEVAGGEPEQIDPADRLAAVAPSEPAGPGDETGPELSAHRRTGSTAWGGLLFLVALADEIGLPAALEASSRLAGRPFRWSLHRLALALVASEVDDPAVLAFAGLPPGAEPPSADAEPPSDNEMAALAELAVRLGAALAERLACAEADLPALVERVARRPARVLADPGWLEIRLSLADVSTELRRARLDLDPGWVPWLGAVLRFVYE